MKKIILLFLAAAPACIYAQLSSQYAAAFLLITPDSRAGALGDAGAATAPDASSVYWNLSKLSFTEKRAGFAASYVPWQRALVPDQDFIHASGYIKTGEREAIGASFRYFTWHETLLTGTGGVIRDFKPSEYAADIGYTRKLHGNISAGLIVRYIHSNLWGGAGVGGAANNAAQAFATDISLYSQQQKVLYGKALMLGWGINISNIGSKIVYPPSGAKQFLPANLRAGTAATLSINTSNKLVIAVDLNKLLVPAPHISTGGAITVTGNYFTSFSDAPGGFKEELEEVAAGGGMEYDHKSMFKARAGYYYSHPAKGDLQYFTFGTGFAYKNIALDLSYILPATQRSPLENTFRFTLAVAFDKPVHNRKRS